MFISDKARQPDERILHAIAELKRDAPTVHPAMARHILATSGMETAYHFLISPQTSWAAEHGPCGVGVVGLELGKSVSPESWRDPLARRYLLDNNLVTSPDPNRPGAMLWATKLSYAAPLSKRPAAFFEDVLRHRLGALVQYFSIGPTQMYLKYAGTGIGGSGGPSHLPQSWSELMRWYIRSSKADWFRRAEQQYKTLPASGADNDRIDWLRKYQTGYVTGRAEAYYHGTGAWTNTGGWHGKLNKVSSFI